MTVEPLPEAEAGGGLRLIEPALLFAGALALLLALSRGLGLTWDESTYFIFSDTVAAWFRAGPDFSPEALQRTFAYDPFFNPHPPLFKILDAVGAAFTSGWLPFPLDYRFAHLAYVAGCLALIYSLLRGVAGKGEALIAIVLVSFAPRVLGDLLVANTDGPVMISWLAAVVLAWRIAETPEGRSANGLRALLILVCACAGATKFTGLLIGLPIGAYFLFRRRFRDVLLVALAFLAALVLTVAVSPDKWAHPVDAVAAYLSYPFHRSEIPIPTTYLGKLYPFHLPWHYFVVMSAVTFPLALWLCLPGLFLAPARWRSLVRALALPVVFWLVVVHLPNTPRHDGVRQFVSVYPLLALLSFIGLLGYRRRLAEEHPRLRGRASLGFVLLIPVSLVVTLARTHPFELSYYNAFIGGIRGAEASGMEITYYFEALSDETLLALENHVQPGEVVGMSPFWSRLLESYRDHGRLHMDFRLVDYQEPSDWLLLYRRRHMVNDDDYRRVPAVHEIRYNDVSLLKLVRRGRPAPAPSPDPGPR